MASRTMPEKSSQFDEQQPANLTALNRQLQELAAGAKSDPAEPSVVIRLCRQIDFETVYSIINDAAEAYRGIIPADRWKIPYMSQEELRHEIAEGVVFWGYEETSELVGVMGIQDVLDVTLIRHAYVRTARRGHGIGRRLLAELRQQTARPILMGTWAAADWAIRFYQRHGFQMVSPEEKNRLLRKYWSIPDRQIETSVVLVDERWWARQGAVEHQNGP